MKVKVKQQIELVEAGTLVRPPWKRRPGEPDRAWVGFQAYLTTRSIKDTAAMMGLRCTTLVHRWQTRYDWNIRAAAYDDSLIDIKFAAAQRAYQREGDRMGVRHAALAMDMQALAQTRVQSFINRPELQETMTIGDATRLAGAGVDIERKVRGEEAGDRGEGGDLHVHFHGMKAPEWAPAPAPAPAPLPAPTPEVPDGHSTP